MLGLEQIVKVIRKAVYVTSVVLLPSNPFAQTTLPIQANYPDSGGVQTLIGQNSGQTPEPRLIGERQQTLNRILSEYQSQDKKSLEGPSIFVNSVIYDPGRSRIRELPSRQVEAVFNNATRLEEFKRAERPILREKFSTEEGLESFLDSQAFRVYAEREFEKGMEGIISSANSESALTPFIVTDFGEGYKPDIYIFEGFGGEVKEAFGNSYNFTQETILRAIVKYHSYNSQYISEGLTLTSGLNLSKFDILRFRPSIGIFLRESNAHMDTYMHFTRNNNSLERLYSAIEMLNFFKRSIEQFKGTRLYADEHRYAQSQIQRFESLIPGIYQLFKEADAIRRA